MDYEGGSHKESQTGSSAGTRRRWRRPALWTLGGLLIVIVLLVALLPTMLSTGPATRFIVGKVNDSIPGSIAIDDLQLGWFGGQRIDGLTLYDPDGQAVAIVRTIDMPDASLLGLLRGNLDLGKVHIENEKVAIVEYEDRTTNLSRALGIEPPTVDDDEPKQTPEQRQEQRADLSVQLTIAGGTITYDPIRGEPVTVSELQAALNVPTVEHIDGSIAAAFQQGAETGRIEAKGEIHDLFNASGALTLQSATLDVQADLTNVPVVLMDRLMNRRGKFVAITGDSLDATIRMTGELLRPDTAIIEARSETLTSTLEFGTMDGSITASPDSTLRFTVTPEAWPVLVEDHATLADSTLVQSFEVVVNLQNLKLPRENGGIDLPRGSIEARITSDDIIIRTNNERIGTLALRDILATAQSKAIGESIDLVAQAIAEQDGNRGRLDLTAAVNNLLDADDRFNAEGYSALVDGRISDLPMAVVDELVGLRGVLVELLGPTLQATLGAQLQPVADAGGVTGPIVMTAEAPNLSLRFTGTMHPQRFALDAPAELAVTVQPGVLARAKREWPHVGAMLGDLNIGEPARAQMRLTQLVVPWSDAGFDPAQVELGAELRLSGMAMTGDERLAGVRIANLTINMPATHLGEPIRLTATGDWSADDVQSTLAGSATVTQALEPSRSVAADVTIRNLPVSVADAIADRGGQLVRVLGPALDEVTLTLAPDATRPQVYTFEADVNAPRLTVDSSGHFAPATGVQLATGSSATLQLTPEAFVALQQPVDDEELPPAAPVQLRQPMEVALQIEQARYGWTLNEAGERTFDPANTSVSVRITSPGGAFDSPSFSDNFEVRNVDLSVIARDLRDTLTINADADLSLVQSDEAPEGAISQQPPVRGRIRSSTSVTNLVDAAGQLSAAQALYTTQTTMQQVPVALLDLLLGQEGLLPVVLERQLEEVSLTVRSQPTDRNVSAITGRIVSQRLNARLTGQYVSARPRQILLRTDGPATLDLTPQAFAALRERFANDEEVAADGQPAAPAARDAALVLDVQLARTTRFELSVDRFVVGMRDWGEVQADAPDADTLSFYEPDRTGAVATLRSPNVALDVTRAGGRERLELQNMTFSLDAPSLLEPIRFSLEADTAVTTPGAMPNAPGNEPTRGSINSQNILRNLINPQGRIDAAQSLIETNTRIENVLVAPVAAILDLNPQFAAILGRTATLDAVGTFATSGEPGPMTIDLNAEHMRAHIAANFGEVITLREDVTASVAVTPPLIAWLKLGNPILADVTGAREPIRITVFREGFSLPVAMLREDREAGLQALRFDAELELGTLLIDEHWLLNGVLAMLQHLGGAQDIGERGEATFTNMRVSVSDGFARSNDVWLQTSNALVGVQGGVNLINQYANIQIGIGAQTLRQFPKLRDSVPANEVYSLPVRGPIDNLGENIDWAPLVQPLVAIIGAEVGGDDVGRILRGLGGIAMPKGNVREWANYPRDVQIESAQPPPGEPMPEAPEEQMPPQEEAPDFGDLLKDLLRERENNRPRNPPQDPRSQLNPTRPRQDPASPRRPGIEPAPRQPRDAEPQRRPGRPRPPAEPPPGEAPAAGMDAPADAPVDAPPAEPGSAEPPADPPAPPPGSEVDNPMEPSVEPPPQEMPRENRPRPAQPRPREREPQRERDRDRDRDRGGR